MSRRSYEWGVVMPDDQKSKLYDRIANIIVGGICGAVIWVISYGVMLLLADGLLAEGDVVYKMFSLKMIAIFLLGGMILGLCLGRHFFEIIERILMGMSD